MLLYTLDVVVGLVVSSVTVELKHINDSIQTFRFVSYNVYPKVLLQQMGC